MPYISVWSRCTFATSPQKSFGSGMAPSCAGVQLMFDKPNWPPQVCWVQTVLFISCSFFQIWSRPSSLSAPPNDFLGNNPPMLVFKANPPVLDGPWKADERNPNPELWGLLLVPSANMLDIPKGLYVCPCCFSFSILSQAAFMSLLIWESLRSNTSTSCSLEIFLYKMLMGCCNRIRLTPMLLYNFCPNPKKSFP